MTNKPDAAPESEDATTPDPVAAVSAPAPQNRRKTVRAVGILLGILTLFVVVLYGVAWTLAGNKVPSGTLVQGIDLTGLSKEQAIERLKTELASKAEAGITLVQGDRSVHLEPSSAGLKIDYQATVEKAGGRTFNPVDIWRVLFGGGEVALVTDIDDSLLRSSIEAAAPTFALEGKSASVSFKGTEPVRTEAVAQTSLQIDDTMNRVKTAWAALQASVEPALEQTDPPITTAAADAVVESYAKPAVSGPVEAVTEKGTVVFTPEMIAGATTFIVEDNKLVGSTSIEKLIELGKPAIASLKLPAAKDATFDFVDGSPKIVPSVEGLSLDPANMKEKLLPLLTQTSERKAEIALSKAAPKFSTADAEKLGIKEVTGEFTTYFPDTAYRNNNLPKAARALNGTLIKPGETFSFNKVVGQRTTERGYMAGGAICDGNRICQQLGGGVSQVATTTFNAFFFSGLKHITHQPHTLYFDRYPAGRESTIDWGRIDVSFHNDTPYGVYIQGIGVPGSGGSNGSVTIRIWSTKEYDVKSSDLVRSNYSGIKTVTSTASDCKPQAGQQGFDVNYKRLWYKNGTLVKEEPYFWRYYSADRIICQPA